MVLFIMFKFSKRTEYALLALNSFFDYPDSTITAKEVAEQQKVSVPLLAKILQLLKQYQVIHSVQGAKGGYRLSKKAADLSLADLIEIIDGPISVTECRKNESRCERQSVCRLKSNFIPLQQHFSDYLSQITIYDFLYNEKMTKNE